MGRVICSTKWGGHKLSTLACHRGSRLWHCPQLLYDDSWQGLAASGLKCNTYELGARTALVSYAICLVQCGMVPAFSWGEGARQRKCIRRSLFLCLPLVVWQASHLSCQCHFSFKFFANRIMMYLTVHHLCATLAGLCYGFMCSVLCVKVCFQLLFTASILDTMHSVVVTIASGRTLPISVVLWCHPLGFCLPCFCQVSARQQTVWYASSDGKLPVAGCRFLFNIGDNKNY